MQVQRGFSLIELMVSIGILVIVAGIGTPMMTQFFQNSRISAANNDLYAMVNVARAEAIRRNTRVTLCGLSAPSGTCLAVTGNAIPFETYGWAIFEDTSVGASSLLGATAPSSQLIRVQTTPPPGLLVRSTFGYMTFSPMGQALMSGGTVGGSIKVCKGTSSGGCDASLNTRCIMMSGAGSPSVMVPTGSAVSTASAGSSGGCV